MPTAMLVYLLLVIVRDANRVRVGHTMVEHDDPVFDDRLSGGSNYGLGTVGRTTTDRVTAVSSIAEVTTKDGKTGSRSLEFKLLSGKTTILTADNRVQVRDVLHKLPGADWLSIGGQRIPPRRFNSRHN